MAEEVRVDPKSWFSAERTFVAWMHLSLIAAGASLALMAVGQTSENRAAGLLLMVPAIFLASWGAFTYKQRCTALSMKSTNALMDPVGPAIAVCLITVVSLSNSYLGIRNYLLANR
mmetsp:Transcript_9205/g.21359  ORF Transcript_9205/g.21359 Transcript_9205/m.21359 type:complete len:116 (-) Transcript_9205:237-584(-)|eukprot:CAMPEP_0119364590 /NCGR_PEP_ID=MMETSP1334-20130426/11506_1 /TAXON_ID=127549 /ORGANISM="Calcidiscus leptoporus, Strain RCC1130" /LENGTH=115 /DNA_ID=CAMNT_0007380335 /DNA_START=87 /DNA_END=434 /DNA_ORIENTATION=-